jgi:hypothetical protein
MPFGQGDFRFAHMGLRDPFFAFVTDFPAFFGGVEGKRRLTVAAEGESTSSVPGSTLTPGSNGTLSQPVGSTPGGSFASKAVEPSGKVGFGSPHDSPRNQVE